MARPSWGAAEPRDVTPRVQLRSGLFPFSERGGPVCGQRLWRRGLRPSLACPGDVSAPAVASAASASPGSWLSSGSAELRPCVPGSCRPAKPVTFPWLCAPALGGGLGSELPAMLWERSPGVCLPAVLWAVCCPFGCACVYARVRRGGTRPELSLESLPCPWRLLIRLSVQTGHPVRMCAHTKTHA